jgi:guanylate kinase
MRPGTLYVISAPSGAGKTSLLKALVERTPDLRVSVSYTTRAQRPGESHGVHYHFVDRAEFQARLAQGDFLEHAQVFGNLYGTSRSWVEGQLTTGSDVILEIDWQGARQVRGRFPDCLSVFIVPPSRQELERRLRGRGQDSDQVIAGRMAAARAELSHYAEYDFLVVNDDFGQALAELGALVLGQRLRLARQRVLRARLLDELLA